MTVTPYIMFSGTCEEALNFYAKALGGEITELRRFEGSPAENMAANKQQVMHARFAAKGIYLMASDGQQSEAIGNRVQLSVNIEEEGVIDAIFDAMSEGATVTMPVADTFWGARFGMLTDRFGVNWMFNYEKPRS